SSDWICGRSTSRSARGLHDMASISREANGRKVIQFSGAAGVRRSIRLGKASLATAQAVKTRAEQLDAASIIGHGLDNATAEWVASLDGVLYDRLAAVGLVPKRDATRLGPFLEDYIGSRGDVKTSTATVYGHTKRCLIAHFG